MARIGILSALLDEQRGLLDQLTDARKQRHANRTFWTGRWHGHEVVLALTRVGKVAAATTTAALIEHTGVDAVLFTGVAGGVGPGVAVGDVVVAQGFVQHDMDARPLFARYEIPLYQRTVFDCDHALTQALEGAVQRALERLPFGVAASARARWHRGLVASGDLFVGDAVQAQGIVQGLAAQGLSPLAVEMEGAAVAQVCLDYGVPFAAMRTISDRADAQAHQDFAAFVAAVAGPVALAVIQAFIETLQK